MNVRQLEQFVAVAETLHFSKAAVRLHMTQPPLSQSIIALEKELGQSLFIRSNRKVQLTGFGEQWLEYVKTALQNLQELPAIAEKLQNGEYGNLSLTFISYAGYNILPTLVKDFRQHYPNAGLTLTEATSDVQMELLKQGKTDIGIVIPHQTDHLPAGLMYQKILSEPLIAAVPELWLEEGKLPSVQSGLCPQQLISLPLVMFPQSAAPPFYSLVMRYYAAHGAVPVIAQQAIQMQTIISLVAAGIGIALVPASLRQLARQGVVYLDLPASPPQLEIGFIWRQENSSPVLHNLITLAANIIVTA